MPKAYKNYMNMGSTALDEVLADPTIGLDRAQTAVAIGQLAATLAVAAATKELVELLRVKPIGVANTGPIILGAPTHADHN